MWTWSIGPWVMGILVIWGVGIALRRGWTRRFEWMGLTSLAWMVFFASWFVCARPVWNFEHYQLLLVPGMTFLTAATLGAFNRDPSISPAVSSGALAAIVAFLLIQIRPAVDAFRQMTQAAGSPVSVAKVVLSQIEKVAPGTPTILIWGWFPSLYVETDRPMPTRHSIAHFLYGNNPSREFLRATYMSDLEREPPQVIVDTHGRSLDRVFSSDPISDFPALNDYVRAHFALVSKVVTSTGPIEIYVRRK
jgi:hypothetical protein